MAKTTCYLIKFSIEQFSLWSSFYPLFLLSKLSIKFTKVRINPQNEKYLKMFIPKWSP
jgi:hypothetical protein